MIDKIAKSNSTHEVLRLNKVSDVVEKLNYYRSLFGKIQDLSNDDFEILKKDVSTFFNIKLATRVEELPKRLVRISNNNRILSAQGKELSYLTDISQLLAPPIEFCGFGRCNIPNKQILYCATSEAGAYWETRPNKGDVITLSHFELKPSAKINAFAIKYDKTSNPKIENSLQEIYYHLEDFFLDVYSLEISRDRPRDYLFSALISSDYLFYPIPSEINFEAIMYPSVQKKKFGVNFAIRNEVMLEKYNLIGVETRFILDEYQNLNPSTEEVTTDQVIGSFGTDKFDFVNGKILYDEEKANKVFEIFRSVQIGDGVQTRYEHEGLPKNLLFNLSPPVKLNDKESIKKIGRNDRINVIYQNGNRKDNVKYKTVQQDIEKGICKITSY